PAQTPLSTVLSPERGVSRERGVSLDRGGPPRRRSQPETPQRPGEGLRGGRRRGLPRGGGERAEAVVGVAGALERERPAVAARRPAPAAVAAAVADDLRVRDEEAGQVGREVGGPPVRRG